jgi:4-hydroxy-4-methyl-2-oxoglutarate aldolase
MPEPISPRLLDELRKVETATVGHFRHDGFLDPKIRAVTSNSAVGTAVTVRIPGADSALLHHAISLTRPGDFLVVDRVGDTRHACWGGVLTHAAQTSGLSGSVIDGLATDLHEVRAANFPLWCLGSSAITTKLLAFGGGLNVPVSCGGVAVKPGDAILADENGVVVLGLHEIEQVTDRALSMQDAELELLARISEGETLGAVSGATEMIDQAMREQHL